MRYVIIGLVIMLSGCNALQGMNEKAFNAMPSAKNCSEVSYIRKHRDIAIEAKCDAPVESASTTSIPGL